jgi:hypothetical protein
MAGRLPDERIVAVDSTYAHFENGEKSSVEEEEYQTIAHLLEPPGNGGHCRLE